MSQTAIENLETEEYDYEDLQGVPLSISMLAGSLAGISEHAFMFPVDVVRTRMQILTAPTGPAAYTSILNAMSRISSLEGAKTLWRGVSSVIVGAGPAHALYFGTYEVVKDFTGGNREGHQWASTGERASKRVQPKANANASRP